MRDIDSGMVIPVFEVSAGSSGTAFMAATTFHDWEFVQSLAATLDMAAFPSWKDGQLKYCASNQVGDAAVLYASVLGPLWERTSGRLRTAYFNAEAQRTQRWALFVLFVLCVSVVSLPSRAGLARVSSSNAALSGCRTGRSGFRSQLGRAGACC